MEACDRIVTHPAQFPELQFPELSRRRRSERREAIVLVLKAEALRMDLASLRVGTLNPDRKHVTGIPVVIVSDWTGLTFGDERDERGRSGRRAERAFSDIARAGYQVAKRDRAGRLRAPQPIEIDESQPGEKHWRGLPAVRRFALLFFRRAGVALKMELARKAASKMRSEIAAEEERARAAAAASEIERIQRRPTRGPAPPDEATAVNDVRRSAALSLALRAQHPDWSIDEIRAETRRRMATGPPFR